MVKFGVSCLAHRILVRAGSVCYPFGGLIQGTLGSGESCNMMPVGVHHEGTIPTGVLSPRRGNSRRRVLLYRGENIDENIRLTS